MPPGWSIVSVPETRAGDHTTSPGAAETFEAESAKQITSGTFDDSIPNFTPTDRPYCFCQTDTRLGDLLKSISSLFPTSAQNLFRLHP